MAIEPGESLDAEAAAVRLAVYRAFAERGAPPSPGAIARSTSLAPATVNDALQRLHAAHALVLAPAQDAVRMAHPFSAEPMGYVVRAAGVSATTGYEGDRMWWGGCAWDSFGISAALGERVTIGTRCPQCGRAIEHESGPELVPTIDAVVHLPWPAARWWNDVVSTCSRIRTFCSREHVEAWLALNGSAEGTVVPLAQIWELAHLWYSDRLSSDWRPRTRESAQELLTRAGLGGEFWRLP